jgi:hypothetical protein
MPGSGDSCRRRLAAGDLSRLCPIAPEGNISPNRSGTIVRKNRAVPTFSQRGNLYALRRQGAIIELGMQTTPP